MTAAIQPNDTQDDIETSAADTWVTIEPGGYGRFGVYMMEDTYFAIRSKSATTVTIAWRTEKRGRTFLDVSPQITYQQWARLTPVEDFFLFVENRSETDVIEVRTGHKPS